MKVLILGASGFIGFPAAQALSRAGHIVYGLTRSAEKAKQLAAEEIIPIVGEPAKFDDWLPLIPSLDVVIDALGGTAPVARLAGELLDTVSQYAKAHRSPIAPKLSYIYTSGTWVHGDSRTEIISDTTPLVNNVEVVAWRPAVEQRIVNDPVLNGVVIRPALLYGKGGSLLAPLFKSAGEGKVAWYGTPGGRFALIHPDDLGDLYVLVAEKAQLVGGKIFDAANNQTESVDEFLQKLVQVSGAKGPYEFVKPTNAFERALASTCLLRPYLARALLGWQPRKPGLIEGLPTYYATYKASL